MAPPVSNSPPCRICEGGNLRMVKESNIPGPLECRSFAITDKNYGVTAAIYRCLDCGFLQCSNLEEMLVFYEGLEDPSYEDGRGARALQAAEIVALAQALHPGGRLLDIGAGTGILIEQALKAGYDAEGLEPSGWLCEQASKRGLPVRRGIFPGPDAHGLYDVMTLVDVIEHVPNPVDLLQAMRAQMAEGAVGIVVTPDVKSFTARLLGYRWWHYRIAHISYFDRATLTRAIRAAGFEPVSWSRPAWYFPVPYLLERIREYLPLSIPVPAAIRDRVVRVDLRDSLTVVVKAGSSGRRVPSVSHETAIAFSQTV